MESHEAMESCRRHGYRRSVVPARFESAHAEHAVEGERPLVTDTRAMMKSFIAGCVCAVLLVASTGAWAHHSAAGIDQTKTITVVGMVKEFKWANPHSWIDLDVTDQQGQTKV